MHDPLEKYITQHRDEFDLYQPSGSVWEKLSESQPAKPVRKLNWKKILSRAAAIVIIFMSSYFFQLYLPLEKLNLHFGQQQQQELDVVIPELEKAEAYYSTQVSHKLMEVRKHSAFYPELERELNYDLNELDSVYNELKDDLKDGVASEEVIDAMIQNYKLKLQILEDLLFQLQQQNLSDSLTNEKKEYKL